MAFKHYKYFIDREPLMQFACFECRKSFKRKLGRETSACPQCGKPMCEMGRQFKAPKLDDAKQWRKVEALVRGGITSEGIQHATRANRSIGIAVSTAVAHSAGSQYFQRRVLGFRYAPPQALCRHPLRGLTRITPSNYLIAWPLFTTRVHLPSRSISER
jgi:hypothetical protein